MDEFEKALWPRQIIGAAYMGVLVFCAGYIPHMFFPHWVLNFWLDVGLIPVAGIVCGG